MKPAADLTYENMVKALGVFKENNPAPERHSIEGLKERIVFCGGQTIAILRSEGYVYCIDEETLAYYKKIRIPIFSRYLDEQFVEQGCFD